MNYELRKYWNNRAATQGSTYVSYAGKLESFESQRDRITPIIQKSISRCENLLDFGCGVGRFSPVLAELCEQYTGVDLVSEALKQAPRLKNTNYVELPSDLLPFSASSFDVVVAITVFQHIVSDNDFNIWTKELVRVLRKGGQLFVIDHNPMVRPYPHMNPRGSEILATALSSTPFVVKRFDSAHWWGIAQTE